MPPPKPPGESSPAAPRRTRTDALHERRRADEPTAAASPALEHVVVVLYETQDLVNIAGVVRAMANTGLRRLRLVNPAVYDDYRILGIAHQGGPVLERVELHDTLESALGDAVRVVGTSARRRTARFVWQHPRAAAPELIDHARAGDTIALVFGREDVGLTNEQLDACDVVLTVPTDRHARSLNLAQAVLLVCYELFVESGAASRPLPRARRAAEPATWQQQREMFDAFDAMLSDIGFYRGKTPSAVLRTFRAIARRARLDAKEASLIRALAFEIRKTVARLRDEDWRP
ncbi:MAG: RNA methyltransferase [Longimicrobiales bacterium]